MFRKSKKDNSKEEPKEAIDIKMDSAGYEADNVEVSFAEIQAAMRLGVIAVHSVNSQYVAGSQALRTYSFTIYEEQFVKLQQAEKEGFVGRTDEGV